MTVWCLIIHLCVSNRTVLGTCLHKPGNRRTRKTHFDAIIMETAFSFILCSCNQPPTALYTMICSGGRLVFILTVSSGAVLALSNLLFSLCTIDFGFTMTLSNATLYSLFFASSKLYSAFDV